MWLDLEIKRQYRFDGIIDHRAFFDHLSLLLDPTDTLVLGCYEAREDIRHYLMAEALPTTMMRYELQRGFDLNRASYPCGAAYYLRSAPSTLERVADYARSAASALELCDHVAAYSSDWPVFIFHDAFSSYPFYVSSRVSRALVENFSQAINIACKEIDYDDRDIRTSA